MYALVLGMLRTSQKKGRKTIVWNGIICPFMCFYVKEVLYLRPPLLHFFFSLVLLLKVHLRIEVSRGLQRSFCFCFWGWLLSETSLLASSAAATAVDLTLLVTTWCRSLQPRDSRGHPHGSLSQTSPGAFKSRSSPSRSSWTYFCLMMISPIFTVLFHNFWLLKIIESSFLFVTFVPTSSSKILNLLIHLIRITCLEHDCRGLRPTWVPHVAYLFVIGILCSNCLKRWSAYFAQII